MITSVSDHELEVSANTPFPIATDEQTTNEVVYSIGWTSPGYAEIELTTGVYSRTAAPSTALATELIPYGTSRMLQATGTVILSGKPVQDILRVFSVAAVDQNVIQDAVGLGWSDFEDAVQMAAAYRAGADYLITRNPKDFKGGPTEVVQPGEFLALLRAPHE